MSKLCNVGGKVLDYATCRLASLHDGVDKIDGYAYLGTGNIVLDASGTIDKCNLYHFYTEVKDKDSFITDCLRTESLNFHELTDCDGTSYSRERLLHAAMGLQTETAEFTDALKKSIFYGNPLDVVNLKEEIGDVLWYLSIAMDVLSTDFNTEQTRLIAKLKARFPSKFDEACAINRDLKKERHILEG